MSCFFVYTTNLKRSTIWWLQFCLLLSLGFSHPLLIERLLMWWFFFDFLQDQHVFLGRKDSRFWSFDPSKGFSCKSPFHILSVSHSPRLPQFLPLFGRVKYQRRPNFFEWQDLHGRVNTIDHVQHHSSFMLHLQWCIICRQQEDLHHLL